jgi:RNA polymerase sigma-70 factor, ECF subfamily
MTVYGTGALGVDTGAADTGRLYARYGPALHRYCASRVGQSAAEDVVAETFLRAHEMRGAFDAERGTVQAWLFGIAIHRRRRDEVRGLRALARTGVDPLVEEGHADRAIDRADATRLSRVVAAAMAKLPQRQRDVLLLYAVAQLEYGEIATTLGIPLGTVQSALFRARVKIRAAVSAGRGDPR